MNITIKYKARITWTDFKTFQLREDILCNVVHVINAVNLTTVSIDWTAVEELSNETKT